MTSMPFDASIYQNSFHNAPSNVAASLDDPNPSQQPPSGSPSYFDLARLDSHLLDDPYTVYLSVANADSTTAPNDVFLYTSSQATTTPPVQTISPTEIHRHSHFCLCRSPGAPVVDPPSPTLPQILHGSSAYVQHQIQSNPFFPSFPTSNGTLATTRSGYSPQFSPERRHSLPSPQRPVLYHNDSFHRRSSWVAPPSASMHMEGYLQYPFIRTASLSSECESPFSIGPMSLSSMSSNSLYTPAYNSPAESPLVTHDVTASLDALFSMSAPPLPAESVAANLQKEFAPAATHAIVEDNHFIPTTLDVAQTTLDTSASPSEEDIISLALVAEELVDTSAAPLPVLPSHIRSPESLCQMQTLSPFPISATSPSGVPTDDSSISKTKESQSRARNVQKESFAARHRIQVETCSFPASESSSLVHRTRRGRPSGGPIGDESSTKLPGVPLGPINPRPVARRARQRKRNGGGDENYGGPEKKFKCEHCGQTFGRKEHVKRHVSGIHQQVKAYQCDICGMCCSRSDNLRQHMRAHERDGHLIG